jgi:hypothetical protein
VTADVRFVLERTTTENHNPAVAPVPPLPNLVAAAWLDGRSLQLESAASVGRCLPAIVLWNTVYLEQPVAALERQGTPLPTECLLHLSPLGWEHIRGRHTVPQRSLGKRG